MNTNIKNPRFFYWPVSIGSIFFPIAGMQALNPALNTQRVVKTHLNDGNYSLINKQWHFIYYKEGGEELYNIQKDPMEFDNLIESREHHPIIEKLKKNIR